MINTKCWKNFYIGDLFEIILSSDDIQPKNFIEGNIPLVSSGKTNNGIVAYIQCDTAKLHPSNSITVDMFGKAFYQKDPYYAVSHGRVNILKPKFDMNMYHALFFVSIIEKVTIVKYSYSEMCTKNKLLKDIIYLPIIDNNPDYDYMESFIKQIVCDSNNHIANLRMVVD